MISEKTLLALSAIAAIISILAAGFVYIYTDNFKNTWLTGFATDTATVNLTVESQAAINFTTDIINFSSGRVQAGANATLDTASGTVTGGNWTAVSGGLQLENIGNVNTTLFLKMTNNASGFFGGTAPAYRYNVTNNESGSCKNFTVFLLSTLYNVNASTTGVASGQTDGQQICDKFYFADANDRIRIDIQLVVPSDSRTGALSDTITATAYENSTV